MTNRVWSQVLPSPRLYSAARLLAVAALLSALISIGTPQGEKESVVWLLFATPVLWVLWLSCALFIDDHDVRTKLFVLWAIINAAIWAFFISFSIPEHWTHARDQDVVVSTMFFPVVMPVVLLLGVLPAGVGDAAASYWTWVAKSIGSMLGDRYGELLAVWIVLSVLAGVEAELFVRLSNLTRRWAAPVLRSASASQHSGDER